MLQVLVVLTGEEVVAGGGGEKDFSWACSELVPVGCSDRIFSEFLSDSLKSSHIEFFSDNFSIISAISTLTADSALLG